MADWWQWSPQKEEEVLTFAVVGVGRFGTAVCRELISNGVDVLAADASEKAIDDLRQLEPSIEARVIDCTDEESMKESGILEMNTVVVGISEPIEASITTTLIAKDSEGSIQILYYLRILYAVLSVLVAGIFLISRKSLMSRVSKA